MANDLQKTGAAAIAKTPLPLQRLLYSLNPQFVAESGQTSAIANPGRNDSANIAGVQRGSNRISVMKPEMFSKNAPQLVAHEGLHDVQDNWPPSIQAKIPADNPNDPYNYGGDSGLKSLLDSGKTIADMPREQSAAAMQYGVSQGMPKLYQRLANTLNAIPLSTIDQTDPSAKGINMHPRAPLPPVMNYANDTYKKGDPPPANDPYAAYVETGTVGGKTPEPGPGGYAEGVSKPSAVGDTDPYAAHVNDAASPDEPYSTQLLRGIPGAAKQIGKGILEGTGSDLANLTGNARLKALTTPSGDENDIAGQSFGKGLEQAGEFMIPGLGEEKAVSLLPDARFVKPLAKIGYNAITGAGLNALQGGSPTVGAIAGGAGSIGGQALEAAAPSVAENALGIRGKFDRSFNKAPGRAVLDEIKGLRPDTIAENARTRINDLSGQVENMADRASSRPNAIRGLLPAPAQSIPLQSAEDVAGASVPQGTLIQPPVAGRGPIPSVLPNRIASLQPARDVVNDALATSARQNAEGAFGQLGGMGDFLNRQFTTGAPIPADVTPRQLLDLRRGFNEEFGQWNPERKDLTVNTGRKAYGALTNEFHNVLPEAGPIDARISSLIPVKNRAQIRSLGDDTLSRVVGRFARPTGALAGLGTGAYLGGREGGVEGAIGGGLAGLILPEVVSSPSFQMGAARLLNNAGALRPLTGAILNVPRYGK